jgi:SAM-dependent methyltransferase
MSEFLYDRVLYESRPVTLAHPGRIAALGILFGMEPAPVERCRVLELGSGDGSNLLPLACAFPESRFAGVDLAAVPVAAAREAAGALGLSNIEFRHGDLADVRPEFGEFDYIVAHGVYSWTPAPVRDRLVEICSGNLAPNGIAFVSYNTFPGCHQRRMLREMMLYHTRDATDPEAKLRGGLELVNLLAAAKPKSAALAEELRSVGERNLSGLFHDDLAEVNDPVYFYEFVEHARRHGLQFLAEAQFSSMQIAEYPPEVTQALSAAAGEDPVRRQQYLDFLKCRRFRQSLLCHGEARLETPAAERVRRLWAASPARPGSAEDEEQSFATRDGAAIRTSMPLAKAALAHLASIWPRAASFEEVLAAAPEAVRDAAVLSELLLKTFAAGLVELHACPSPFAAGAGERPRAFRLARYEAARGRMVTTLRHSSVELEDAAARKLLQLLDGSRDRAAILRELERFTGGPVAPAGLEAGLAALARMALLEA